MQKMLVGVCELLPVIKSPKYVKHVDFENGLSNWLKLLKWKFYTVIPYFSLHNGAISARKQLG